MPSASELRAQVILADLFNADLGHLETRVAGLDVRADVLEERLAANDTKLGEIQQSAREHEQHDVNRFLQLHQEMSELHYEFEFVRNFLTILQDSMIEGFRKLGAEVPKKDPNEVTPPRVRRNGR